jgi:hypothetical protein
MRSRATEVAGSHFTANSTSHAGSGTGSRIMSPCTVATSRRTMLAFCGLSLSSRRSTQTGFGRMIACPVCSQIAVAYVEACSSLRSE